MSTEALKYFTTEGLTPQEEYNQGLALLMSSPQSSRNLVRTYNNRGYSDTTLKNLKYDLMKAFQMKDQDIRKFRETAEPAAEQTEEIVLTKRSIQHFVEENKDRKVMKIITGLPEEVAKGMKLYTQYPFLRTKECPNEFKILVGDAITAFESYRAGHEQLFEKVAVLADPILTNEEIYEVASLVLADFELNRECHAELEHYAKTGEILGDHEIFADLKLEREIAKLSPGDLAARYTNFKSYVSKAKTKLKENKDSEKAEELQLDVASKEKERDLVKKYLDAKK
jgi:hypothetical protein